MNTRNFLVVLLLAVSVSVQADAYKCKLANGKIVYQSEQCAKNAVKQGVVKVKKISAEEAEAAQARMKAWEEKQAVEDAAKKEAEKAQQAELREQETLELQRRSVAAQEQQAAKPQPTQNTGAGLYDRRFSNYPYNRGYYPYPPPPYPPHHYNGEYYQYPDQPKRRPGEYPYPSPPTHPRPFKIPESEE